MKKMLLIATVFVMALTVFATTAFAAPRPGTNVYRIPTTQKVVALTFDDAWNNTYMAQILDVLAAEGVHATFFPTGAGVEASPDLAARAIAEGHVLGSHGYRHSNFRALTNGQRWTSLRLTRIAIQAVGGRAPAPLFRTPYGYWNKSVLSTLRATGYANILWNLNANDTAYGMTVKACEDRVVYRTTPGTIVLLHTQNPIAPKALPGIIQRLKARGYRFVTLREAL